MTRSFCRICELGLRIPSSRPRARTSPSAPDPDNPYSKGYFCVKGRWAGAVETDSERLDAPLIRRDGRLAPVSWTEAVDTVGAKLRQLAGKHGPRSIAVFSGNSAAYSGHLSLAVRNLMAGLGTDTLFTALTVDCIARYHVAAEAMNLMYAVPVPFYDRVPGMLMMGSNATVSQWSPGGSTPGGARVAHDLHARGGLARRRRPGSPSGRRSSRRPSGHTPGNRLGLSRGASVPSYGTRSMSRATMWGDTALVWRTSWRRAANGAWPKSQRSAGSRPRTSQRVFEQVVSRPAVVLDRSGVSMAPNATIASGLALAVNASLGRLDVEDGLFIPDYSPVRGRANHGRPDGVRLRTGMAQRAVVGGDPRRGRPFEAN